MNTKNKNPDEYFNTDHLKKDLKSRAVKGGGLAIFTSSAKYLVNIMGTIVLARLLAPADFGLLAMVSAITEFFFLFQDLGLTDAVIQAQEINHRQISTVFWINLVFGLGMAILIIALSPAIAWFYSEPRLKLIAIIVSTGFIFSGLSIQHRALLKRSMKFRQIAAIEVSARIGSILAAIIMALYGCGYWSLVARPVIYAILGALISWVLCSWRPGLPTRNSNVSTMIRFGAHTTATFIVHYFATRLDKILVGWKYGAAELGYYHKAYHLYTLPVSQLTVSLQHVAVGTLSKLRDDPEKYRSYYLKAVSIISFVGFPFSAFLVAMSKHIILLLLGPQWGKTAAIFSIFGVSAGIQMIYSTRGWLHSSLGRAERWFRWDMIGSALTVAAVSLGLIFGTRGVAITYTCITLILVGPGISYAGSPIGIQLKNIIRAVWRYIIASITAGFLCWYLFNHLFFIPVLFLQIFLAFIFYSAAYLLIVILLFGSVMPITQFVHLLSNLLPRFKKGGGGKKQNI